MNLQDDVGPLGDHQVPAQLHGDPHLAELIDLVLKVERIHGDPVANDIDHRRAQDARGNQVQDQLSRSHVQGVSGVVPSAIANHVIRIPGQGIDDLPLAFITP